MKEGARMPFLLIKRLRALGFVSLSVPSWGLEEQLRGERSESSQMYLGKLTCADPPRLLQPPCNMRSLSDLIGTVRAEPVKGEFGDFFWFTESAHASFDSRRARLWWFLPVGGLEICETCEVGLKSEAGRLRDYSECWDGEAGSAQRGDEFFIRMNAFDAFTLCI